MLDCGGILAGSSVCFNDNELNVFKEDPKGVEGERGVRGARGERKGKGEKDGWAL